MNIKGLKDGNTYYVNRVDANTFQLMSTAAEAIAGTSPLQIDKSDSFTLMRNNGALAVFSVETRTGTHHLDASAATLIQSLRTFHFDSVSADPPKVAAAGKEPVNGLCGPGRCHMRGRIPGADV